MAERREIGSRLNRKWGAAILQAKQELVCTDFMWYGSFSTALLYKKSTKFSLWPPEQGSDACKHALLVQLQTREGGLALHTHHLDI